MKVRTSRRRLFQQGVMGSAVLLADGAQAQPTAAPANAPEQLMRNMIAGSRLTQMIHVAAKLRLADHLRKGPQSVAALAAATKTHEDSLYRLLRTLAGMGIFAEEDARRFRLTPAAELLQTGVRGSLRVQAEVAGEEWMWRPWGSLLHSIQTGETAFNHLYGKGTFDWFPEHPAAARLFDELQSEVTLMGVAAVVAAYDFSAARQVVDVGGGEGLLLSAILQRNENAHGVLFDLAHVITSARTKLDRDIARRSELVPGDFFQAVPKGGDIYVMKNILHDWDDARARKILASCRAAMEQKGKLLVVEEIICERNQPCQAKVSDVLMLVRTGGRNRTEKEYRDLLDGGGFSMVRTTPTSAGLSVIEAVPRA